jgi:hypothetical protein
MSSSNISNNSAAALNDVNMISIMFIIGFVGHSLNICVFTRPTFRYNPCVRYLLASSISGYLIIFVLFDRILPCWFIAFASVDRFLCSSSSTRLRAWSSIRISKIFNFIINYINWYKTNSNIDILWNQFPTNNMFWSTKFISKIKWNFYNDHMEFNSIINYAYFWSSDYSSY